MKKKKFKRLSRPKRQKSNFKFSSIPLPLILVGVIALAFFVGKVVISSFDNSKTLGTTSYLAKGDDSGSGSSGSGSSGSGASGSDSSDDDNDNNSGGSSSGSGSSGSSGSGSSGSGSSGSSGSSSSGSDSNSSVSSSSTVDCVGPDGKKFTTTFKACEDLNKSWGKMNFSFTVKSPENKVKTETRTRSVVPTTFPSPEVTDAPEFENEDETGIRTQTEIKQDETRTEVRLSETERIRTRTKDGRTRIDITSGGIKTRLEFRDDRVVIKAEQEDGTEVELEDDTLLKIDERLGASGIKVATAGAEKFVIQRGIAGAVTDFPVSIDLATNALTVNTPTGQRTLTVLPDQAIQNLLAANIVSRIGGQAVIDAARSGELTSVSQLATLGVQNGVPIYEINGISDQKLLGFIPVAIEKTVTVSAQTGEVVSTEQSFVSNVLDLLAF